MVFSEKLGDGVLRNQICPFCESGKKYKKCQCSVARKALISSTIPKESDLIAEYKQRTQNPKVEVELEEVEVELEVVEDSKKGTFHIDMDKPKEDNDAQNDSKDNS